MKPIWHSVLRKFWTSKWEGAKASQAAFRSLAISLQDLGNEPWEDFNNQICCRQCSREMKSRLYVRRPVRGSFQFFKGDGSRA